MLARARADVHQVVGGAHGVLVVLHHDEGVAHVPQLLQGAQELGVVPLVQADAGLVQDIEHPHEGGADLGGQADALGLAAGESGRGPGQGEVLQTDALQKAQPGPDLLENPAGDEILGLGELLLHPVQEAQALCHREVGKLRNAQAPYRHRQDLLPEAAAAAGGTGDLRHALLDLGAHGLTLGLHIPALQVKRHALKGLVEGALSPLLIVVEGQLFPLGTVEDGVQGLRG